MKLRIVKILILFAFTFSFNTVHAENSTKLNKELLLAAQVDAVLSDFYSKKKITDEENAKYFSIALISSGKIPEAKVLLSELTKSFPKETKFKEDLKNIYIFEQDFKAATELGLNETEQAQLEIKQIFFDKNITETELLKLNVKESNKKNLILSYPIFKKLFNIDNRCPYFPSRLEYLFLLVKILDSTKTNLKAKLPKDIEEKIRDYDNIIRLAKEEIKDESKKIIAKNQKILFPKTLDFYELAEAYRVLALLSLFESQQTNKFGETNSSAIAESQKKLQESRIYLNMAQINFSKMRSLWLEEDIKYYKPIMKQYEKVTEFGYVLPQWIITLKRIKY
ncbi:MAG: hypothetical protein HRT47_07655 [Candidatus Caenarcaniphilales bacterium]|nr:hypothetical protein [Candidatus Caenarcaniphilales bacterium]